MADTKIMVVALKGLPKNRDRELNYCISGSTLKCPCNQTIDSYFSVDFKTLLTKQNTRGKKIEIQQVLMYKKKQLRYYLYNKRKKAKTCHTMYKNVP